MKTVLFKEDCWEVVENNGWKDLPISVRHSCIRKGIYKSDPRIFTYHLTYLYLLTQPCGHCGLTPPESVVTIYILLRDNYISDDLKVRNNYYLRPDS